MPWPSEATRTDPPAAVSKQQSELGYTLEFGPVPTNLRELVEYAPYAAIVSVQNELSFWRGDDAGAIPITAVNFAVRERVYGELPNVVQVLLDGGRRRSRADPAHEYVNSPLPKPGTQYVIFLQRKVEEGRYSGADVFARFVVRDGTVYSPTVDHNEIDVAIAIEPTPVDEFVEKVRRLNATAARMPTP